MCRGPPGGLPRYGIGPQQAPVDHGPGGIQALHAGSLKLGALSGTDRRAQAAVVVLPETRWCSGVLNLSVTTNPPASSHSTTGSQAVATPSPESGAAREAARVSAGAQEDSQVLRARRETADNLPLRAGSWQAG